MENNGYINNSSNWVTFEEGGVTDDDDVLSFSNFSMLDNKEEGSHDLDFLSPRDSISLSADHHHHDFFDGFFNSHHELISPPAGSAFSTPGILFCCKITNHQQHHQLTEYQKRDYLSMVRPKSSRGRPGSATSDINSLLVNYENNTDPNYYPLRKNRSISLLRFSTSQSPKYSASNVQKVNITSLTSMSATSRRRMFMFGPVKFKPEMELSAIKERQGRRRGVPATMFPAAADGGKTAAGGGGGKWGSHWQTIRSLRDRAHLSDVLTKSFGCFSIPGVGGEKGVRVVN